MYCSVQVCIKKFYLVEATVVYKIFVPFKMCLLRTQSFNEMGKYTFVGSYDEIMRVSFWWWDYYVYENTASMQSFLGAHGDRLGRLQ